MSPRQRAETSVTVFMSSPWVPLPLKYQLLDALHAFALLRPHTMASDPDGSRTATVIADMLAAIRGHLEKAELATCHLRYMASSAVQHTDEWHGFPFEQPESDTYPEDGYT